MRRGELKPPEVYEGFIMSILLGLAPFAAGITDGSHSEASREEAPPKVEEIRRLPIGKAR